jgi:hypothetical protein
MKENTVKTNNYVEQGDKSDIVDIANEDWPMLQEINKTRYTIKNKKNKNGVGSASLAKIKKQTQEEDIQISNDFVKDEIKVEEYLQSVKQETVMEQEKTMNIEQKSSFVQELPKNQEVIQNHQEKIKGNKILRLFALGLAKIYIRKTSTILDPLSFVLENKMKVLNGILQTIIPALMTWYLVTSVTMIATQLAKESTFVKIGYGFIFYFACMFVWITGQVMISGLYHVFKKIGNEIVTEGSNSKKN